jgi:DNA-binding CsgD family transcriptional regulator
MRSLMYTLSHKSFSKIATVAGREMPNHRYSSIEELLDALAAGILLTDPSGRVLYMNHAAKCYVKNGDALSVVNQRLKPRDDAVRASLMTAIAECQERAAESPSCLSSIPLPGVNTSGLVASILPLDQSKNLTLHSEITAAVFLEAPIEKTHLPSEAFAKLYGLTDGELRMLISISLSYNVEEAAAGIGIKTCTAKTHLQHIYEKTGTTKLSQLLALFMHSVLRHELAQVSYHYESAN